MKGTGKRVLALMLSVAMVATSGNLTMDVYAMGNLADMSSAAMGSAGDGSDKVQGAGDLTDGADVAEGTAAAEGKVVPNGADAVSDGKTTEGTAVAEGTVVANGANTSSDANAAGDAGASDGVQTVAADSTGTGDADDPTIIDQNDYFVVIGVKNGKLQLKQGVSLDSLSGTVILPSKTKWIPAGIFTKNTKITGVTIPEDNQIERIDAEAFAGSAITSFELPDGVTQIEKGTFKNSKLKNITFGAKSQLVTIGEEAFTNCEMTSVSIPASVKEIGDHAFDSCSNIYSIQLSAVEVLGDSAFKNCRGLQVIGWSKNLKEIRSSAFYGCSALKEIKEDAALGAGVTTWGESVFEGCSSLVSVRLHKDTKQIPAGMFKNCTSLTTIVIPEACGVIKRGAFSGCIALPKITIPAKVSAIEADAFADCQKLTKITIEQKGASGESDIILSEDAFPLKSGVTMEGYDGTVEDYATRKNYKFTTLFVSYKIAVDVNKDAYGKAELSKTKARVGEIIEVKITPATGYRLKASTFKYNSINITNLKEEKDGVQVFTFVMPDERVDVNVDFESASTNYGTLSAAFDQIDQMTFDWDKSKSTLTFDKTGLACQLVVHGRNSNPGVWMFNYTSNSPKIVSVDSEGVIYARGVGTATVTAALKEGINNNSTSVSFKVKVLEKAEIDHYDLTFTDLGKAKSSIEEIAGESVRVIRYTKDNLTKAERSFKVGLHATDGANNTNLFVQSFWESANTDMVTVDNETVENNSNVIRVLKGVTGETAVTVTVTNGKTGKNKVTLYEESFIIRVIDATPRLVQSTLTVNSNSTAGTAFDLLSVYGYEVDPATVKVVEKVTANKITDYEVTDKAGYVSVRYANGKYYLDITNGGKSFIEGKSNKAYSKMYLEGEYHYRNDSGDTMTETFRTPIKSLVLTCKALKPTVKCSGKINLFFNHQAAVSERGQVTLTQSLKNLNVTKYELISAEHYANPDAYEKEGSTAVDALANNFDITDEGVISRSSNELIKDAKGKAIVKGYVRITYEGYDPCYANITIPTNTTKPGYVLSKTKATVNTFGAGYSIELQLLDKKTKKPLSLNKLTRLSFDELASGATPWLFENLNTEAAKASDKITLQIKTAQKGKAVINVEMDTWNEPMKFTFNLSVTQKAPTVKAKPTTLTLNNVCVGRETQTVLTLNQADATLTDMGDGEFVGKASLEADASMISFTYENGVLSAKANGEMHTGSYKFRFTPTVTHANGTSESIKPFTLTIKVIDTRLTATLKPSSVTLNNQYRGKETGVYNYTIKNMPAGESVEIWTNDGDDIMSINGVNQSSEAVKDAFDIVCSKTEQSISVKQKREVRTGSYKYEISGLKAKVDGKPVDIQPFKITVKVINRTATLTTKAKGTLSIGNNNSSIVYTLKLGNLNAKIEDITFTELDTSNKLNNAYEGEDLTNFTTEVLRKADGSVESFVVRAKAGVILDAKRTYKFRVNMVEYDENTEQNMTIVRSKDVSIKPKQTLSKVKTDMTSATFYAGVAANSPKRSQEILINATDASAEISYVIIADSNPDNLKKAFRVEFNQATQKAKLTLVRPDLLKPDTVYSLRLETRYKGQMENTKGTQFNVDVKVLN